MMPFSEPSPFGRGLLSDQGRKVLKVVQEKEFNTFRKGQRIRH
jgi:hypothetical protein